MTTETTVATLPEGTTMDAAADDIASSALPHEKIESPEPVEAPAAEPKATPPTAATSPAPKDPTAAAGASPQEPKPGEPGPDVAPDSLTKEIKEKWATLDPAVKAEFVKRETDFRNGLQQLREPAELGNGYLKVIGPYLPAMRQYGVNPVEHTENLLKYHAVLMFGNPEQKAEILRGLANDAGMDLRALAAGQIAPLPDQNLVRELAAMKGQLSQVQGRFSAADAERFSGEIDKMAGNAEEFPHFWQLAPSMVELLNASPQMTLDGAYRAALAANPQLFQTVIDARAAKKAEAERLAAQERAAKARKATGVSLDSSSGVRPASHVSRGGSFDIGEMVEESLDHIKSSR